MFIRSLAILLTIPYFIIPQWSAWYTSIIFWVGLLIIGIPHGAVDHHIQLKEKAYNIKELIVFVTKYVGIMALFFLFWLIAPTFSIAFFILISAYHFGMVDFGHPKRTRAKIISTVYGITLLGTIIFSDRATVSSILKMLSVNADLITSYSNAPFYIPYFLLMLTAAIVAINSSPKLWWTIALLLVGTNMPLLLTFGLYFSFQHAIESTLEIKNHLNITLSNLVKLALPFSLGAYSIGALVYLIISWSIFSLDEIIPFAFLFLGMVTLPHVFYYSFDE